MTTPHSATYSWTHCSSGQLLFHWGKAPCQTDPTNDETHSYYPHTPPNAHPRANGTVPLARPCHVDGTKDGPVQLTPSSACISRICALLQVPISCYDPQQIGRLDPPLTRQVPSPVFTFCTIKIHRWRWPKVMLQQMNLTTKGEKIDLLKHNCLNRRGGGKQ